MAMVPQPAHIAIACGVSGATAAAVAAGVKAAKFFTSQAPNRSATPSSSRNRVAASLTSNGLRGSLPIDGLPRGSEEEHGLQGGLGVVAPSGAVLAGGEHRRRRAVVAQVQAQ